MRSKLAGLMFVAVLAAAPHVAAQSAADELAAPGPLESADDPDTTAPQRQELDAPTLGLPASAPGGAALGPSLRRGHRKVWFITGGIALTGAIAAWVLAGVYASQSCGMFCSNDPIVITYGIAGGVVAIAAGVLFTLGGVQWADVDRYNAGLALDANGVGVRW